MRWKIKIQGDERLEKERRKTIHSRHDVHLLREGALAGRVQRADLVVRDLAAVADAL